VDSLGKKDLTTEGAALVKDHWIHVRRGSFSRGFVFGLG